MSDFRRNNASKLRCYNRNSVIDGNLKLTWTVGNNMPMTLAFVALYCRINLGKVLFRVLAFIVIRLFSSTSLTVGIAQGTLFFEFWLKEFIIWSRLLILAMISTSVG